MNEDSKLQLEDPNEIKEYVTGFLKYVKKCHVFKNEGESSTTYHIRIRISPLRYIFTRSEVEKELDIALFQCMPRGVEYIYYIQYKLRFFGIKGRANWESEVHMIHRLMNNE